MKEKEKIKYEAVSDAFLLIYSLRNLVDVKF
jgi:hypothetical protein